jgi:superfamily I DNA and RNA helicase
LTEPARAIERIVAFHTGREDGLRAPGPQGAEMLRELLAPEVHIEVPMVNAFSDEEEQLVKLTYEQAALLGKLARNPRVAVYGCAGSGKTMLGVERAKRLASEGRRVLFVCFNRGLRDHLRTREHRSKVEFATFHGLCTRYAHEAKVPLTQYEGDPPQEYWDEELPAALMAAMEGGGRYDAVFVDEAQDLSNDWLDALESTLSDPDEGLLWLFLDDNQRIYDQTLVVPKGYVNWDLTVNCRNTQAIHREVMKLYQGEIRPEVRGPAGRDIEFHPTNDQSKVVAGVLQRLCGKEEILEQDIVVLSSHGTAKSEVAERVRKHFGDVRLSSIRGFKGLEAPVVVLCELEDLDEESRDQQLYVGLSRAKNHCVVVAPA